MALFAELALGKRHVLSLYRHPKLVPTESPVRADSANHRARADPSGARKSPAQKRNFASEFNG